MMAKSGKQNSNKISNPDITENCFLSNPKYPPKEPLTFLAIGIKFVKIQAAGFVDRCLK